MSTSKHINKICLAALVFVIVFTVVLIGVSPYISKAEGATAAYESKLFDNSRVHTLDVQMDDWEDFLSTCTDEKYSDCDLVIDGETFSHVALRAKGNTSLTSVEKYGNDRYSFKVEFDHYDDGASYYGLDKLCLNNVIQDNTYMKDFLCYKMMAFMGVPSPLCSYVYITVNGEDFGLYLAVEGVEEAFLERNFSSDGELYKPDSSEMGGGPGNGKNFDGNEIGGVSGDAADNGLPSGDEDNSAPPGDEADNGLPSGDEENSTPPGGEADNGLPGAPLQGEAEQGGAPGDMQSPQGEAPNGMQPPQGGFAQGEAPGEMQPPKQSEAPGDMQPPQGEAPNEIPQPQQGETPGETQQPPQGEAAQGGTPGNGDNRNSDVLLIYTDDDFASYPNIFDNAKTSVTDADKRRLIAALKNLNEQEDPASTVDADEVLRYFAVHNFVLNFDSYTGGMIHNYYLYENDGKLSMLPWDYNLAFGAFVSGADATGLVNYPIDTPTSGDGVSSRPMLSWIFSDEQYAEKYHRYLGELVNGFFENGYFEKTVAETYALIAPYVEKDPSKFCSYDEFNEGVDALKEFCELRAQSVSAQLSGLIPSTKEGQAQDDSSLISAEDVSINAMGSMGAGGAMPDQAPPD